jgi:hypothetical protein
MKRRDLITELIRQAMEAKSTFGLVRHGANHDVYEVGGVRLAIPRHREISENLARAILRQAATGKGGTP